MGVTFAFGLGQPALMEAVGDAVHEDVRGVALGIATLFFLVGGGVGSAVVGGLGDVLGMAPALLLLAVLPLVGLAALVPQLLRPAPAPAGWWTSQRPSDRSSAPGVACHAGDRKPMAGCLVLLRVAPSTPRKQ